MASVGERITSIKTKYKVCKRTEKVEVGHHIAFGWTAMEREDENDGSPRTLRRL